MGIRVLKGGMMTTVQDLGRTGYQSQGFSVSGVMDVRSFKIANLLLDNPENEAVLEFTLIGPTLEFTSETIISITGGDFRPQINGKPAKMYTAIYMHRGDILTFGGARTGTRGYIAFSSYLDVPVVMGSRSTNIKCQIGGYKGRKLEDEDYIAFRAKRRYLPYYLSRSLDLDEFDQEKITLRVVMGPQEKMYTKEGRETFLNTEYTVTVSAVDAAGNDSGRSAAFTFTTLKNEEPAPEKPSAPTNVKVSEITHTTAIVTWEPAAERAMAPGYNVYLDDKKQNELPIEGTEYKLTGLKVGTQYNVAVTVVDADGMESDRTEEVEDTFITKADKEKLQETAKDADKALEN